MLSHTSDYFPPVELREVSILFHKKGISQTEFLANTTLKTKKIGNKTYVSIPSLCEFADTLPKTFKEYLRRVIDYNIRLAIENKLITYASLVRKMRKINETLTNTYYVKGRLDDASNLSVDIKTDDSIQIDIDKFGYGLTYSETKRIITNIRKKNPTFINIYELLREKIQLKQSAA